MEIWATSLYFSLKLSSIGWGNYLDGWLGIISCVVEVFLLVFVFIWLVRITFIIFPIKPLRVTVDMTNASQSKPPSILFSLECLKNSIACIESRNNVLSFLLLLIFYTIVKGRRSWFYAHWCMPKTFEGKTLKKVLYWECSFGCLAFFVWLCGFFFLLIRKCVLG